MIKMWYTFQKEIELWKPREERDENIYYLFDDSINNNITIKQNLERWT